LRISIINEGRPGGHSADKLLVRIYAYNYLRSAGGIFWSEQHSSSVNAAQIAPFAAKQTMLLGALLMNAMN
jgi:hypothetical protein